jgi:predicted metal-binding membrane protein
VLVSAAAWTLLVIEPSGMVPPAYCSAAMPGMTPSSMAAGLFWGLTQLFSLAVGWGLMLAAMMLPLLIAPVRHIRDSSFARRRVRAIALFATGYAAIWMPVGIVLLALALEVRLTAPGSPVPVVLVIILSLVWQFSPVKQRCLNRCHAHTELAAFGLAADLDALRFGLRHGIWCVGSCWALMLLPLLVLRGHLAAMAVVTLLLLAERLDSPAPARWCWRAPATAVRIAVAQARIRLQRS